MNTCGPRFLSVTHNTAARITRLSPTVTAPCNRSLRLSLAATHLHGGLELGEEHPVLVLPDLRLRHEVPEVRKALRLRLRLLSPEHVGRGRESSHLHHRLSPLRDQAARARRELRGVLGRVEELLADVEHRAADEGVAPVGGTLALVRGPLRVALALLVHERAQRVEVRDRKRKPHLHPRQRFERLGLDQRVLSRTALARAPAVARHDEAVVLGQPELLAQAQHHAVDLALLLVVELAHAQPARPEAEHEQHEHRRRDSRRQRPIGPPAPEEVRVALHAGPHHALAHVQRTLPAWPDHRLQQPLAVAQLLALRVQHRRRVLCIPERYHLPPPAPLDGVHWLPCSRQLFVEVHHLEPSRRPLQVLVEPQGACEPEPVEVCQPLQQPTFDPLPCSAVSPQRGLEELPEQHHSVQRLQERKVLRRRHDVPFRRAASLLLVVLVLQRLSIVVVFRGLILRVLLLHGLRFLLLQRVVQAHRPRPEVPSAVHVSVHILPHPRHDPLLHCRGLPAHLDPHHPCATRSQSHSPHH
eukprot:2786888-Rhodomonas_salina.2